MNVAAVQHRAGGGKRPQWAVLPRRTAMGLVFSLLAIACQPFSFASQATPAATVYDGKTVAGVPVAPEFTFTTFDGRRLSLADLKGKAVVLNFWASWCVPCRTEMPYFETTYRTYQDRGVLFVGLAVQDDTESAHALVKELGITYPAGLDDDSEIAMRYRLTGLPTTVFIGRDGTVVQRRSGAITEKQLTTFVEAIAN